ncbi:MAG: hypothetical protein AAGA29_02075, partial [Planctomycetota bacterium]
FIAQPPLYQVTRRKKSEYVLNERKMREVLGRLGVDGTTLVVYNPDRSEQQRVVGDGLAQLLSILEVIADLVQIAERRGITLEDLLALREKDPAGEGRMPRIRLTVPPIEVADGEAADSSAIAGDHFFWSEEAEAAFRETHRLGTQDDELDEVIDGKPVDNALRPSIRKELHEVRDLEKQIAKLAEMDLPIEDYVLEKTRSVTGLPEPTKYELIVDAKAAAKQAVPAGGGEGEDAAAAENSGVVSVVNLRDLMGAIHAAGKRGMDIKRFKGLGEMDAEQLWETTMNPENRVLLRVSWDAASEAEKLFSVLMGENVEPRRKYIEDHALEAKNLDV